MFKKYKDYFLNLITSLSYLIGQIAILFYFSKFIGISETGYYSMSIAITAPVFMLTNFQLKWILATEKSTDSIDISSYYHFRFLSSFIALIGLLFYAINKVDNCDFQYIFILVMFTKYFESLSDLNYGYLQLKENYSLILLSSFFKSLLTLFFIFFDYNFIGNFKILLLLNSLSYLIIFIVEYLNYLNFKISISNIFENIKLIFLKNWKFSILSFFYSLRVNFPRYILGQINVTLLGVFSTLSYLNYGSNFIFGSLSEVSNVKIKSAKSLNPILNLIFKFGFFSMIYTVLVYIILYFTKDELLKIIFKAPVIISNTTINLILINGFLLNVILVLDNMFMIFRLKNQILILIMLEFFALYIFYSFIKVSNLVEILIIQNFITFCFIILTIVYFINSFKKKYIK